MQNNMEHILLCPKAIKGANKLPIQDLRQIANFYRVVKNYIKMCRIEERYKSEVIGHTHSNITSK